MNKNESILQLSKKEAYEKLENIAESIESKYGVSVKYRNDLSVPSGSYNSEQKNIDIGIKGLKYSDINMLHSKDKKAHILAEMSAFFSRSVPDLNFTLAVSSIFHERQHLIQDKVILQEDNEISRRMAIQNLAITGNNLYYHENYSNMLIEIDAEYQSVLSTKEFFEKEMNLFPEITEKLLVDCYNYKASAEKYWLHESWTKKPFEKLEDIDKAFTQKIEQVMDKDYLRKHSIPPMPYSDSSLDGINDEKINITMIKLDRMTSENKYWLALYCDVIESRGYEAELKLAALTNYFNPEFKQEMHALDKVDLNLSAVFPIDKVPPEVLREEFTSSKSGIVSLDTLMSAIKSRKVSLLNITPNTNVKDTDNIER